MGAFDDFMLHVQRQDNGCWLWLGGRRAKGHGSWKGSTAHRWLYAYQNDGLPKAVARYKKRRKTTS